MAYENLAVTVIKDIPVSDNTIIRIQRLCNKSGDVVAVDIRQWYCTDKNPEFEPTRKGVRIKDEMCPELLDGIITACSHEALLDLNALNPLVEIDTEAMDEE